MTARTRFKLRRGPASEWTLKDPVLLEGEPGYETDTNRLKVGDGRKPWSFLPYLSSLTTPYVETWGREGEAQISVGSVYWYNYFGFDCNIIGVWVSAGVVPLGSDLVIDVMKNDVSIFEGLETLPRIPDGDKSSGGLFVPETDKVLNGEYLSVNIVQVGSTQAGSGLTVGVVMEGDI